MISNSHNWFSTARGAAALALSGVLALGCAGDDGAAGPQGPEGPPGAPGEPGELDPNLSTVDKAVAALGGQATLDNLTAFTVTSSGSRLIADEGFAPGDSSLEVSTFDIVVTHDIEADSIRYDWDRAILFVGGLPLSYSEIIAADVGVVDGIDSFFGVGSGDMSSARWAAVRKQHRLLNPQLIIKDVTANPDSATEAGVQLFNGAIHEILRVDDPTAPMDLFINASTGRIAKISTIENHHLHRDVVLEAHYVDWQVYGAGTPFPADVFLTLDGEIVHVGTRSNVEINPTIAADAFDFPPGSTPVFDEALANFGEASHQFHQTFGSLGIPLDIPQVFVLDTELAPGVFHLTGGSHHSMAIEQDNGVVILEAPLYPERSEAIIAWAAGQFPGKPITHVVATHHHLDHSSGLRAFVATGATIVIQDNAESFFRAVFRAPSTVVPDALAQNPADPVFQLVAENDLFTIDDGTNPVTAYHLDSVHANDMLIVHVETPNMIFQSDLFNPGNGGAAIFPIAAEQLRDFIVDLGFGQPEQIGGHGATGPFSELDAFVNNQ